MPTAAVEPRTRSDHAVVVLAVLGALDAAYLTLRHLFEGGSCDGCDVVTQSEYARVLGLPLAAWGLGLYLAILFSALRRDAGWVFLLAVLGNLFTPYLIWVQAARLGAWCPLCLFSAALLAAILVCSWRSWRSWRPRWSLIVPALLVAPALSTWGLEEAIAARDVRRALAPPETRTNSSGSVTIDGRTYDLAAIDRDLSREMARLAWVRHKARLDWVKQRIFAREAEAQGLSVDELVKRNVDYKIRLEEDEIERAAQPGVSRRQTMGLLALAKRREAHAAFLDGLAKKYEVEVDLPPPDAREGIEFNPRGGPEHGPADAPLQIVVFSDFQCPACAKVHRWLARLPDRFGVEARVAFRHYPLGPGAVKAARAAAAAHAQGRFRAFADALFKKRGRVEDLDQVARAADLDLDRFRRDLAGAKAAVDADVAEAEGLGVSRTPTLFINGVHFVGVPDDRLVRALLER